MIVEIKGDEAHFLDFHSVACSSEMVGSSLEELSISGRPIPHGWECRRYNILTYIIYIVGMLLIHRKLSSNFIQELRSNI